MESRQVSVFRIERHRGRRAVATTDLANGRARAGDSLAVVIVAFQGLTRESAVSAPKRESRR
jgi:hypothetical protein